MSVQTQIDRINQNVANTYAVLKALGADMPTEHNSDNLARTAGSAKTVLYSEQTLTDEQKAQARANIGALSDDELNEAMDARVKAVETKSVNNETNIGLHAKRLTALESKVGDGFVAVTNAEIDAMFSEE
jgi:hypothetical protein